ncbi:MAG TPA: HEAT repeat domain-containing protein, partial [Waterburya sp.]
REPDKQDLEIHWRQICRTMLEAQYQGRLTTNPLTAGDGVAFELDEIYVPLGLVERKQRDRRSGDVSPEQGSRVYEPDVQDEIVRTFQQDEFFEQVLRQGRSRRIAIIGEPGAGKTTLLQKIAAWVLSNTEDVAIWISLADLQGRSVEQYLLEDWLKAATRKVRVTEAMQEALGELFNSKRVWLLLDAVDEMSVGAYGNTPLQWIANQITGWVADARVVLTCRLNVWDAGKNALEAFETYRNLDFSYGDAQTLDQVRQFIHRWFKNNAQVGDRLRAELDQPGRERIKDAVKNPLRLALLCRTWALELGGLPNTKAGLYQQFTAALYEWKQERSPTSSTQRQELNKALGELAKRAISEEKTKFRLRYRLVSSVLGKPDEELFELALQIGWLNQVGVAAEAENRGEKVYAFYHPTFQEYFAAQAIDDWHYFLSHVPHNPAQGTYRIFKRQWKEVILLWLGREDLPHEQKEEFIKALVEFKDGCGENFFLGSRYRGFYEYRAYFLAAVGVAEFGDCSQSDEIVVQLVKWSFGYFNIQKQEWERFFHVIEKGARATLLEADRTRVIGALLEVVKLTPNEYIRWQAVDSLEKIDSGNEVVIAVLVQLIESNPYKLTRRQAIKTLGKIGTGNKIAIRALVRLIESTTNTSIRWQAADSLGEIHPGNSIAISVLVQLIKSTEDELTRIQAANSLAKIAPSNEIAIRALSQLIQSTPNESICWQAADSLGKIAPGNPTAIAALVQLTQSTKNGVTRRQAAYSLRKIDPENPTAITALMQLIKSSENQSIRKRSDNSLGKFRPGSPTVISDLVKLISSTEDEFTCRQAGETLRKIIRNEQLIELVTALKNFLSNEIHENDFERFNVCYKLIWHCAQTMPYSAFYQAWHSQPSRIHPEVLEITPVGSTPFTQNLNFTNLPQSLRAAIANDPALSHTIQLICIDGSKFIDRNNPAAKIYAQMVKAGCHKCEDGTPKTMPELQIYWDLLDTDKRVVLVFYEGISPSLVQEGIQEGVGFSETFLNALSKFDGAICIITAQLLDNIPLICISPERAIADVVDWLKQTALEG